MELAVDFTCTAVTADHTPHVAGCRMGLCLCGWGLQVWIIAHRSLVTQLAPVQCLCRSCRSWVASRAVCWPAGPGQLQGQRGGQPTHAARNSVASTISEIVPQPGARETCKTCFQHVLRKWCLHFTIGPKAFRRRRQNVTQWCSQAASGPEILGVCSGSRVGPGYGGWGSGLKVGFSPGLGQGSPGVPGAVAVKAVGSQRWACFSQISAGMVSTDHVHHGLSAPPLNPRPTPPPPAW